MQERLCEVLPEGARVTREYPLSYWVPDEATLLQARLRYREGEGGTPVHSVVGDKRDEGSAAHLLGMVGHTQLVLRNDFASRHTPVPWRVSSNWGGDLFLCSSSTVFPPKPEYALHSSRWQDTDASLNQVQLFLCAGHAAAEATVDVAFDTCTPGLDSLLVEDGGDGTWQAHAADQPWQWRLREGLNTLHVRSVNTCGVRGAVSWVQVAFHA